MPTLPLLGDLLEALCAVTPEPPPLEADPAVVAVVAEQMLRARDPLCRLVAELQAANQSLPAGDAALLATLADRDARWAACLSHARHTLGQRLDGSRRLHHAYPTP